jgi:site-specific recombinase XerD
MQKLLNLDASVSTKRRIRASIRKYARFLVSQGVISAVPNTIDSMDLPKLVRNIPRITKSKETKTLLQKIKDPEIALIISILATTGCRISSLADLRIEDFSTNSVLFRTSKGGKPYTSLLTNDTKKYFDQYRKPRTSGYLFLNKLGNKATSDSLRRKLYTKLGKDYVNPHSFRHGIATELIENGVDLTTIKTFMNHTSVTVTEGYIHLSNNFLKDALKDKHPMS